MATLNCEESVTKTVVEVVNGVVSEGDLVYNIDAGDGELFVTMAKAVGSKGSIVGVEYDESKFILLAESVVASEYWNRSLLVNEASQTVVGIFSVLGYVCPTAIAFGSLNGGLPSKYYSIVNSLLLIRSCQPIIILQDYSDVWTENLILLDTLNYKSYSFSSSDSSGDSDRYSTCAANEECVDVTKIISYPDKHKDADVSSWRTPLSQKLLVRDALFNTAITLLLTLWYYL